MNLRLKDAFWVNASCKIFYTKTCGGGGGGEYKKLIFITIQAQLITSSLVFK